MATSSTVSVGIPTYNRPQGLRRTLEGILRQSHSDLEIIVSDNASPDAQVEIILREFEAKDARIKILRQPENIGAFANFRAVLEAATGPFFMWVADDDEHSPTAVEHYLSNIGDSGGYFSSYAIRDYRSGRDRTADDLPELTGVPGSRDTLAYITKLCPSAFYGLYRREPLLKNFPAESFDWMDCYVVLATIATVGFKIENSGIHYYAGVDGDYVLKPAKGRTLDPMPYFWKVLPWAIKAGPRGVWRHLRILRLARKLQRAINDRGVK